MQSKHINQQAVMMHKIFLSFIFLLIIEYSAKSQSFSYPIVDTNVKEYFDGSGLISEPFENQPYFGQDANYSGQQPSYTDNGDSTITDNVTGLVWQKFMGEKISYEDAFIKAKNLSTGGFQDWRVPTIKELYSLILFTGQVGGQYAIELFIDSSYFNQPLGDTNIGEREIDAQTWSSTQYVGLTMQGDTTVFGVNFIDGRIKGYPKYVPFNKSQAKTMYFRMVRGNPEYGKNSFIDNENGTISDLATGLMWQKSDDGIFRNWQEALAYAENLELAEYDDWRLPNAKELQSIVDYSRSPQTTQSPAIDQLFTCTEINDPDGNPGQYPYYWTSTSHKDGINPYSSAVYLAFGEAQGLMNGNLFDVHGAGAQRSDPKSGNIENFPQFFGPQGDVRYVYNAVRVVRDIDETNSNKSKISENKIKLYPNPAEDIVYFENQKLNSNLNIEILDSSGRIIFKEEFNSDKDICIDLQKLIVGFYLVKTISQDEIYTQFLVKR